MNVPPKKIRRKWPPRALSEDSGVRRTSTVNRRNRRVAERTDTGSTSDSPAACRPSLRPTLFRRCRPLHLVASDMTLRVQAADLAIYCVNRGFRLPKQGMDERSTRTASYLCRTHMENAATRFEKRKGGKAFRATHEEPPRDPTSGGDNIGD